jgi:hypothetical protein
MSSPVRQQSSSAAQPLQSALKKRVEQDNKTQSRGGGDYSDQKSVAGGKSDSPLKQAQFRLDAPDTPAAFKNEKNSKDQVDYDSKTVDELEVIIETCQNNLEKQQKMKDKIKSAPENRMSKKERKKALQPIEEELRNIRW